MRAHGGVSCSFLVGRFALCARLPVLSRQHCRQKCRQPMGSLPFSEAPLPHGSARRLVSIIFREFPASLLIIK
jgi:hypothetical protein